MCLGQEDMADLRAPLRAPQDRLDLSRDDDAMLEDAIRAAICPRCASPRATISTIPGRCARACAAFPAGNPGHFANRTHEPRNRRVRVEIDGATASFTRRDGSPLAGTD
jgi:hypothetical protein